MTDYYPTLPGTPGFRYERGNLNQGSWHDDRRLMTETKVDRAKTLLDRSIKNATQSSVAEVMSLSLRQVQRLYKEIARDLISNLLRLKEKVLLTLR